jgi:transposase InsO family protein
LRAAGGRPGDRIGGLPVITAPQPGLRPITHLSIEVLRRPVESGQYTSFRFTQHLLDAGIDASIGTVGDALDNALAESTIGLYKTELIKPNGPWHNIGEVDVATQAWVDWYNNRRLHGACGGRPPTEFEALYEAGDLTSLVA